MTFSFNIFYQTDSDVPGDSGRRSKVVHIDAENSQDAFDYAVEKYSDDPEYDGLEAIS